MRDPASDVSINYIRKISPQEMVRARASNPRFDGGFLLQRAADHQRMGGGDFQGSQSGGLDVRLCFEWQQHAGSDGISAPVYFRLQGGFEVHAG